MRKWSLIGAFIVHVINWVIIGIGLVTNFMQFHALKWHSNSLRDLQKNVQSFWEFTREISEGPRVWEMVCCRRFYCIRYKWSNRWWVQVEAVQGVMLVFATCGSHVKPRSGRHGWSCIVQESKSRRLLTLYTLLRRAAGYLFLTARELFLKVSDREYPRITRPCPTREKVQRWESYSTPAYSYILVFFFQYVMHFCSFLNKITALMIRVKCTWEGSKSCKSSRNWS